MRVLRSWPAVIPEGRSYVVDTLDRLIMSEYDYRCLADVDDDIVLIEWDLACHPEEFDAFLERATKTPDDVLVAPYKLYASTILSAPLRKPVWCHRRYNPGEQSMRLISEADESTHLFGLGLTYLPRALVKAYLAEWPDEHFNDNSFSGWHYRNVRKETPLFWGCRPVHLHTPRQEGRS